jgi:NAD kinase
VSALAPRVVVVHRRTELDELVARHGTRQQAAFFLRTRGRSLREVEDRHASQEQALEQVAASVPLDWRRGSVERADLDRFLFAPEDIVIAVGQDGLVANVAKYLSGQPVIGINPDPRRNPGVLVPHPPEAVATLLALVVSPDSASATEARVMVQATTDDGQSLAALNELYIGHAGHQSSRYQILLPDGNTERQSSSGVLVGTGTGCTGWLRSAWIERHSSLGLPAPTDPMLAWFVREAWPSPGTGIDCTEGSLKPDQQLGILIESDRLVVFGDGIESDALTASWGQRVSVNVAPHRLHLVAGPSTALRYDDHPERLDARAFVRRV